LHQGSLAAALASWLDARAHIGKWLIRIEDIDPPRERRGIAAQQIEVLRQLGMTPDGPVLYQSARSAAYDAALQELVRTQRTFRCTCSRAQLASSVKGSSSRYPGTCRRRSLEGTGAVRFRVDAATVGFEDRACGYMQQNIEQCVGDFVIRRADGLWAYQLAVVVDDAFQGITDVVRGADLLDNTPRQIALQRALGLATPRYLHLPLVRDAAGRKLSKQTQAPAIDPRKALAELEQAWQHLGFSPTGASSVAGFQQQAVPRWRDRWRMAPVESSADAPLDTDAAS
jgi:glutamyl-Q tRNA(Asp) synthetase